MGVLNFCEQCGALQVKDVKEELEKLFKTKKLSSEYCGICLTEIKTETDTSNISHDTILTTKSSVDKLSSTVEQHTDNLDHCPGDDDDKHTSITAKRLTRLGTGTIKPQHIDGLDSENDNDSVDIPFNSLTNSADSKSDVKICKSSILLNVSRKRKAKKKNKSVVKKDEQKTWRKSNCKKRNGQSTDAQTTLTETQIALRSALDPKLLAMLDTEVPMTKALRCKECKMCFLKTQSFIKHVSSHTGEELSISKPYICQICAHRVFDATSLERHMARHTKEKSYACMWESCGAQFACQRYLTKHIRRHEGHKSYSGRGSAAKIRKYKCPTCEYVATSKDALSFHFNTHTNSRPFKCRFCDRCFNDPSSKRSHEGNKHSSSRDNHFMCELCGYSSFFKADLVKHQRIHSGDKPFACAECDYRCNRGDNLRKHLRIHCSDKTYRCFCCDMVFHSLRTCKNHEKTHSHFKSQDRSGLQSQNKKSFSQNEKYFSQSQNEKKVTSVNDLQGADEDQPRSDQQETKPHPYLRSGQSVTDQSQCQSQTQSQSEDWIRAVSFLQHLQQM